MPSFRQCVLVSQTEPLVEPFHRQPNGVWGIGQVIEGLDAVVPLTSVGIELPMALIYADVTVPPLPPADADVV